MKLNQCAQSPSFAACAAAVATALCLGASVGTAQTIGVQAYPGITITGVVSRVVQLQYADALGQPTVWRVLTNFTLLSSPTVVFDTASPGLGARFYRTYFWAQTNMVVIPGGVVQIGDTLGDGTSDELPIHTVTITTFRMDKHEVSKTLWETVRAYNGGNFYLFDHIGLAKTNGHPVHSISWYDAVKWCNARSEMEGLRPCYFTDAGLTVPYKTGQVIPYVDWSATGYRLPTEAEWERAARGGTSNRRFSWNNSDNITHANANYSSSSAYAYDTSPTRGNHPAFNDGVTPYTSPVGSFAANAYGLYDMTGNVGEWCWDIYGSSYYAASSRVTDPRGPTTGSSRIQRGGSWIESGYVVRCAGRDSATPTAYNNLVGFRCVRKY